MSKYTPWFNAKMRPPVNGDDDAMYERRCVTFQVTPHRMKKSAVKQWGRYCWDCQWRGLTRTAYLKAGGK